MTGRGEIVSNEKRGEETMRRILLLLICCFILLCDGCSRQKDSREKVSVTAAGEMTGEVVTGKRERNKNIV